MTHRQAELIAMLCHSPGWQAYTDVKQEKLDRIHREMEDVSGDSYLKLQGKAAEIREDFNLQKKVLAMLDKKG